MKTVADMLLNITSTGDELFRGIKSMILNPKTGVIVFFVIFGCGTHFRS